MLAVQEVEQFIKSQIGKGSEEREKGVLYQGRLLSWRKIEEVEVLVDQMLPFLRIPVVELLTVIELKSLSCFS